MPFRVHKKVDDRDVVYTSAVPANEEDGETDITSAATPALSGGGANGNFRDAVYGDEAVAELDLFESLHSPDQSQPAGWDGKTVDELKSEISSRNSARPEADQIVPNGKGNKPDLVAALQADDTKQPEGSN